MAHSFQRRPAFERLETRYALTAGTLEPTFGQDGIAEFGIPVADDTDDFVKAAAQDAQGRIVVAGQTTMGHRVAVVARYLNDGTLDSSFSGDGLAFFEVTEIFGAVRDVAIGPGGNIYLVSSTGRALVTKVRDDGTLDLSFGDGGTLDTEGHSTAISFAPNGDFLLAGSIEIARFRTDGSRVRDFGNLGVVTTTFQPTSQYIYPEQILALPDGSVIIAASQLYDPDATEVQLRLLKYASDGTRDMTFGDGGSLPITVITSHTTGVSLSNVPIYLETEGEHILLATRYADKTQDGTQYGFLVARVTADGELDTAFGENGQVHLPLVGDHQTNVSGIRVESSGSIVIAGVTGRGDKLVVAIRLQANGAFDVAYGDGGVSETAIGTGSLTNADGGGIFAAADGGSRVAYTERADLALLGLTTDGELDPSYGLNGHVITNIADSKTDSSAQAAVELDDGSFLVFVNKESVRYTQSSTDHSILRVWADGQLDTTYGVNGEYDLSYVATDLGRRTQFSRFVPGNDGAFVIFSAHEELTVGKLDRAGNLDTAFGTDGWATFEIEEFFRLQDAFVRPDGTLLVFSDSSFFGAYVGVAIDSSGALDTSFSSDGTLRIPHASVAHDGIAACGHADGAVTLIMAAPSDGDGSEIVLQKLHANGATDTSFGNNGRAAVPLIMQVSSIADAVREVVCLPDQSVLVAGSYRESVQQHAHPRLVLFDPTGNPQAAFGTDGIVDIATANTFERPKGVRVDNNGRLLVGLESQSESLDFSAIRLESDGSRDTSYGVDGIVQFDVHGSRDFLTTSVLTENGDLLLAGSAQTLLETHATLARLVGDRDGGPAWQNPRSGSDVNDDNTLAPVDALIVINHLNTHGSSSLPVYRNGRISSSFIDVNGDGTVAPLDALIVINDLNEVPPPVGEGESQGPRNSLRRRSLSDAAELDVNAAAERLVRASFDNSSGLAPEQLSLRHRDPQAIVVDELFANMDVALQLLRHESWTDLVR